MEQKREQALVGLFVVVATGVLVATVFAIGGAFGTAGSIYKAYFKNAGGLEPGSVVRYAGIKVGRVERVRVDDKDPTRVLLTFSVESNTPIKTDCVAKIASLSALGENYLEILPGKPESPRAPTGSVLAAKEYFGFTDIADLLNDLGPSAQDLVENLNGRAEELKQTIARVNDLLNDQNRANLSATLGNVNGMLEENRPKLHSTLGHIDTASAKLGPLLDDFKKTVNRADDALAKIDGILGENRADLRAAIVQLRRTLADASGLIDQLNRTSNVNAENIDETLENIRLTTENLKQFTETIKTRPYTLIRASSPPDRKPGAPPKP